MKLSKLYCNHPDEFGPIDFRAGLNVVLGEIRLPQDDKKTTHNLGKTMLGRVIDFCFLSKRTPDFFLFKHKAVFKDFVFFLEIKLADSSCLTVRRGVKEASKISFKKHEVKHQDFTDLPEANWDHVDLPFERARNLLDSLLDWRAVSPWDYRNGLGYQLRSQNDFQEVFQLHRFMGKHKDWKPYVAHILGFDHELIKRHYEKRDQIEEKKETVETLKAELGSPVGDINKISGILLLKQKDADKQQQQLDAFDFRQQDKARTKELVDEVDTRIGALNSQCYSLSQARKKILVSLKEDRILFNPDEAQSLFNEVGVLFSGQIKKDFEQLIAFNRAITDERRGYLLEDLAEIEAEIKGINEELNTLGKHRSSVLGFLSGTDVFAKYKQVADDLVTLRADIATLERQRGFLGRLDALNEEIRKLTEEGSHLQSQIKAMVGEQQRADSVSLFSIINSYFSEIIEQVLDHHALLSVSPNKEGHLEFKAEILDRAGNSTSADLGNSYRKFLCIAFDLAVVRAHLNDRFPRFVYHDGVFEALDNRQKTNLLHVIRAYANLGIQPIITLIDSDMPPPNEDGSPVFNPEEIVLHLHDEGPEGRLFRMKAW